MKRLVFTVMGVLAAVLAVGLPSATARIHTEIPGAVGKPITVNDEQIFSVLRVERWYGGGIWYPRAGQVGVSVEVKVEALADTPYNGRYFGLRTPDGKLWGQVFPGYRYPYFSAGDLHRGQSATGWLTFVASEKDAANLALVYRFHGYTDTEVTVPLGSIPGGPTAKVGQTVNLEGILRHTVSRAEAWAGDWKPAAGDSYVTFYVKTKALKPTKVGQGLYSLQTANGTWYRKQLFGPRKPELAMSKTLAAGGTAEGWVTFMIPKSQFGRLLLVFHSDNNGPTLAVPVTIPAL